MNNVSYCLFSFWLLRFISLVSYITFSTIQRLKLSHECKFEISIIYPVDRRLQFSKKKKKNELLQCWFLLICPEFPLQLFHWTFTVTEIFKISDFLAREPTFLMILFINCKILVNKIRWNLHVIAILNQINCELFLITIERLLIIKITFSSVSFTFFFLHEILWSIVTGIHFQSFLTYVVNDKK